ncbi:MAG TPA: hypothetical protein DDY37_02455, partial [Legionella sp.]|nr:hypothetical protein [Legionella sp.]
LPLKETDGLNEILAYCHGFSTEHPLIRDEGVDDYLRPMLSQAGVCRHRANACLMLCAYQQIPCRLVTNDTHAFVEVYSSLTNRWKTIDFGGPQTHVDYYDPLPVKDIKPDEQRSLLPQPPSTPSLPVAVTVAPQDDALAVFKSFFTHESMLNAQSTVADLLALLIQTHGLLLRYQDPTFAWQLNLRLMKHYLSQSGIVPDQYLYVHDPKQIRSLFSQYQVNASGHAQALPGPLKTLIQQEGILLINWSDFSANETATYKSILDQIPILHDQGVNKALRIIGLERQDRIKEDDSFYSRMRAILTVPSALEAAISQSDLPWCTEITKPLDLDNEARVDLYHDTAHWYEALCGKPVVDGDAFRFKAGALLVALQNQSGGIVLYDPPLMQPEFNDFMHSLRIKKQILANGQYYTVPDDFQIRIDHRPVLTLDEVTSPLKSGDRVLEVNSSTYSSLFSYERIDAQGFVRSQPNGLLSEYDHFVLTTPLEPALEHALLHAIKDANKGLSMGTCVLERKPWDYTEHSGLIFSNDPSFVVKNLSIPNSISHYVDLHTTWSDLIETLEVQSFSPLNIKRTPSRLLNALMDGTTIVLYGQMNLGLYQRLSSLFNPQQYLWVNGDIIKPKGQVLFVTPEQADPLYAQAAYQDKKPITGLDYQGYFSKKYVSTDIERLFLIYQLAEKARISLPCNVNAIETCLQQLAVKENATVAPEKVIKSVLLAHYPHHSEEYACINVLAKILFSAGQKPLSVKRQTKLTFSLENIGYEPWQAANCLTGAELMACFDLQDPLTDSQTLFTEDGHLHLREDMQKKLVKAAEKMLTDVATTDIIKHKQHQRFERFLQDDFLKVLILQGDPGVGKTHLVKIFDTISTLSHPAVQTRSFWGKEGVIQWLQSPEEGRKLLILDEYNLEDNAFWSFFEDLQKGFVCYQGTHYPVSQNHKIVCTCNPSYYPECKKQTTLPSQAITLYFKHPDDAVLRQMMIEPLRDIPSDALDAIQDLFLTIYRWVKKDFPEEVSLRDLEMLCQRFCYLKLNAQACDHDDLEWALDACLKTFMGLYPLENGAQERFKQTLFEKINRQPPAVAPEGLTRLNTGYALPSSRCFTWQLILEDIALLRTGNLNAKGGILMEGASGIGKTRMYTEALEHLGIPYLLIASGSKHVRETLQKAFNDATPVVLDELNLDPALEKQLGQYLTGVDAFGQGAQKPGFFVLASQNPTGYAGRKKLAPSLLNRFHRCTLSDYSETELMAIAEQTLASSMASCRWHHQLAQAFMNGFMAIKEEGIQPMNSRVFFTKLDEFKALPEEEMNGYIQACGLEERPRSHDRREGGEAEFKEAPEQQLPSPPPYQPVRLNCDSLISELRQYISCRQNEWGFHWDFLFLKTFSYWMMDCSSAIAKTFGLVSEKTDYLTIKHRDTKVHAAEKLILIMELTGAELSPAETSALKEGYLGSIVSSAG